MLTGKIDRVITMKIYDQDGNFIGEAAKYVYKSILTWYDVAIGLGVAFLAFTQTMSPSTAVAA